MRYEYSEDSINDCITLTDNEEELKTSFDSEIVLYPMDDAITVIDKLNWYEAVVKEMKSNLEYHGWTEDNFRLMLEDVEANME